MFADMEGASNHIHVLYYSLGAGEIGTRFRDMLIKKHREGVEVRVLYDAIGSNETPKKFLQVYKDAGIEIDAFSPIAPPRILHRINYRNHKKIVVIDGKIGHTGGMNVKDEYVKGLSWGKWKDVHVRIEGPGAQGLQSVFFTDWYYVYKEYLGYERYFPIVDPCGDNPLQIVTSEPLGEHRNILEGMIQAIMRAKKSVYIETPYFVPTDNMLTAIQATAMSGIEVFFVMPDRSDNAKVGYAPNSYVEQLLTSNIKVYRYTDGFIHSKLMVINDEITIVGSSNMDIRSFDLNFETTLFIYNPETARKAKEIILDDINNSRRVTRKEWEKRSTWQEFKEAFFRLFSPFL
ncbi:MAG: cardiolipin synthase [Tannerellaceae bacterium]|nr:cardiolipin synthase [Tannerellaceae bacterium]